MKDVPDIAFGKDPLVADHGAVCTIAVPTDRDSILARVYRIYEDRDAYRCSWQMAVKGATGKWTDLMEENGLGAALWNGECWVTEKDPPDWEKHLESYASHDVASIEDLMERKKAADQFVEEAKE